MPDKNELTDLITATVETLLAELRPSLIVAPTNVAMATIDKAAEINRDVAAKGGVR